MLAEQRKAGLQIMAELRLPPTRLGVAAGALAAVAAAVNIVAAMAVDACTTGNRSKFLQVVASGTADLPVFATQRKLRRTRMIERVQFPVVRDVAGGAILSTPPAMHIADRVTGAARGRRVTIALVGVAGRTGGFSMPCLEPEFGFPVIEAGI